ncbi:MAG: FMN-binding protein [Sedimentibacter sp.]
MKYSKKLITFLLVATLLFAVGCQADNGKYKDGVYTGSGEGKYGPIKVEVSVEKGKISTIKVLEHNETPGLSDPALEKTPQDIIKAQSTEVSAVSGATVTSNGIIQAVNDSIKDAQKK